MAMRRSLIVLIFALVAGAAPALAKEGIRPDKPKPIAPIGKTATHKIAKHKATKHNATKHEAVKRRTAEPHVGRRAARAHYYSPKRSGRTLPVAGKVPVPGRRVTKARSAAAGVPLPPRPPAPRGAQQIAPAPVGVTGVTSDERWRILSALSWSGDYAADVQGEDPLVAAIKRYQERHKRPVTGKLTPAQRSALIAADHRHRNRYGWTVVVDPATGIRIGLPTKLVPYAHDAAHGTRWSSQLGAVQVETFRIKQPGLNLADLFEREKHTPYTRLAIHSALNDDSFVISGMQGLKDFSVRATMRDGEVRGFTLLYDQAMDGIVAPVMVAMASAFAPFPERGAPFAALDRSVDYGTGLIVSGEGHIVTARKLAAGCEVIVVPGLGDADRVAVDEADGLALLQVYGQHKLSTLAFAEEQLKTAALTLIGIPDPKEQNGHRKLTAVKAQLFGSAIVLRELVPVAGFSGAAALDAEGRVLGLMATHNAVVASNAPPSPLWLVRGSTIRKFLSRYHVPPVMTPAVEARDAVVRVICVRK